MIQIPDSKIERLNFVIDLGWDILFKKIIKRKIKINKEASLQLQYASVLHSLGELLCVEPKEFFSIELESNYNRKNIDITCSYDEIRAAVELECFKKSSNRAVDLDMYDSLKDMERLFSYSDFHVKKFICFTDNPFYIQGDHTGHAASVSIKNGTVYKMGQPITPSWIGRWKDKSRDKEIVFSKDIQIAWSSHPDNQLYFLKLDI